MTHTYSGDGLRTSATTGGVTTRYVYDVNQSLPVLLQDGSRTYVWGAHGLAYTVEGSGTSETVTVYHDDGLGSVRALTNSAGTVVQTYATDEFGIPVPAGTQGSKTQPLQYTGEPGDAESGFSYLRARMYDPQLGRFLQRDPFAGFLGVPLSLNRYSYVENNPVNLSDPSGLASARVLEYRRPSVGTGISAGLAGLAALLSQLMPAPGGGPHPPSPPPTPTPAGGRIASCGGALAMRAGGRRSLAWGRRSRARLYER